MSIFMRRLLCIYLSTSLVLLFSANYAYADDEEANAFSDDKTEEAASNENPLDVIEQVSPDTASNDAFLIADGAGEKANYEEGTLVSQVSDEEVAAVLNELPQSYAAPASARSSSRVTTYAGETRVETAVMEARAAFPEGAKVAVVAEYSAWADALSATSLAGALGAPILYTYGSSVPDAVLSVLGDLGVERVVLLGSPDIVGEGAVAGLEAASISVERVYGPDRYSTQLEVFDYGVQRGLWSSEWAVVAGGENFPDALSISPFAVSRRAPVFLAGPGGDLRADQEAALADSFGSLFKNTVIVGDESVVSEKSEGFLRYASLKSSGNPDDNVRLYGPDRYSTGDAVVEWLVNEQGMNWEYAAISSGEAPYDALAGSVLQGMSNAPLLLTGSAPSPALERLVTEGKGKVEDLRFFGSSAAVSDSVKNWVLGQLGIVKVEQDNAGISYQAMLSLESSASAGKYTESEIDEYLNPGNVAYDDDSFYQFASIGGGYSGNVTAGQINAFIDSVPKARTGSLAGTGEYFIEAAKRYGVNEVYLLSHAILESGWGTSLLATGKVPGYEGYYNFFGIGAYDVDPNNGGAALAKMKNWDSPRAAVLGAAQWISRQYVANKYGQDTLYLMKWNYVQAARENTVWKQYATSRTWADGIARVMAQFYDSNGLSASDSNLVFKVPRYL